MAFSSHLPWYLVEGHSVLFNSFVIISFMKINIAHVHSDTADVLEHFIFNDDIVVIKSLWIQFVFLVLNSKIKHDFDMISKEIDCLFHLSLLFFIILPDCVRSIFWLSANPIASLCLDTDLSFFPASLALSNASSLSPFFRAIMDSSTRRATFFSASLILSSSALNVLKIKFTTKSESFYQIY